MSDQAWEQTIEEARAAGGKVHAPNCLPIRCIRHDLLMLEHEHGDHPTYMFPVDIEYVGPRQELPEWDTSYSNETHALIYTDGCVAITMYECCYGMWHVPSGRLMGGKLWRAGEWRLTDESVTKILGATPKACPTNRDEQA